MCYCGGGSMEALTKSISYEILFYVPWAIVNAPSDHLLLIVSCFLVEILPISHVYIIIVISSLHYLISLAYSISHS